MTEQEEFEFRARLEAEQAAKPTLRQKIQASVPMRVLQGARDPIDAAAQLLPRGLEKVASVGGMVPNQVSEFFGNEAKRVDRGISENELEYAQSRKVTGSTGFDASRLAGNVVSPANAAVMTKMPVAASTGSRILQGGFLGGIGGALTPVDTEQNPDFMATKIGQSAIGAVTGAVATPVMGKMTDALSQKFAGMGKVKASEIEKSARQMANDYGVNFDNMANAEKQALIDQVTRATQKNAGKDPAALARAADFNAENMPYLTGQVTRDPKQFASEKNLSQLPGIGDPLTERFSQQARMLREKVGGFGSNAAPQQQGGSTIASALQAYDKDLSKGVSSAYKLARDSAGKDAEIPMQGLANDYANVLDSFGDKVPSGVRNQFRKYGVEPGGDMTQRKLFTVEEADKLLKVINANQSSDVATNTALGELRTAVKRSVVSDAGVDDVFSGARKLAAERFSLQDAIPALESAASGRGNPDVFVNNFIVSKSAQTEQVKKLADVLRENNPQAFNEAKSQIGAYLQRSAFGENPAGDGKFNPSSYAKALRELGPEKLKSFFSESEVSQLQRLGRIGAYLESFPAGRMPNTSGNWGAITSLAGKIPGVPASIGIAGALKNSVSNQMNASAALSGKIPAKLSPEDVRLMSQILSGGALTVGGLSAPR